MGKTKASTIVKFRCERDTLVEALGNAGRAVTNRGGALPVLSGVRVALSGSTLQLTGSDLDMTITCTIEVDGQADGVAVVPAKLTADIVKALESGAVTVEVDDNEAKISAGRSNFAVRAIPAAEYPRIAEPTGEALTIDTAELTAALRQVVSAASTDESRPILTGVLMAAEADGLRLVATDSYRLAVRDLPGTTVLGEDEQVLIPSAALRELGRLLGDAESVTLRLGDRDASFEIGSTQLITRLIDGQFPNYRGLIPASQQNKLTVGRDAFIEAVRRVKVVAREPSTPVKLDMSGDGLNLSVSSQDTGNAFEQVDAKYEGTELTVAFNPDYLLAGLEVAGGDEVSIETVDALKPAVLRSTDSTDFLYLLMPVRVA
ncbi:MAG: DNA polymerase III subunit beta [Acidimicrobiales bacterium]